PAGRLDNQKGKNMHRVSITAGGVTAQAQLNDSPTAEAIWKALPLTARASIWGDEIYFGIPVHLDEAKDALEVVSLGDLGYWAPGHAFCIFFGRTPMSRGNEIRPASAVNVFGRIEGDPRVFVGVPSGSPMRIEPATE
ncbi:MAG: cyclophilin-like fold protein, partial [Anaerolineae bacterium]